MNKQQQHSINSVELYKLVLTLNKDEIIKLKHSTDYYNDLFDNCYTLDDSYLLEDNINHFKKVTKENLIHNLSLI